MAIQGPSVLGLRVACVREACVDRACRSSGARCVLEHPSHIPSLDDACSSTCSLSVGRCLGGSQSQEA